MIYYFSATGNSKYVAERIAEAIGDEARSIQGCDALLPLSDVVGLVAPTYAWGLPEIVKRFFAELVSEQPAYAFLVATYGTSLGFTGVELQRVAKRWFYMALLTQMYTGNFESVFEQQMNSIDELKDADEFRAWIDAEIAARLTDDYSGVTLPNELDKNRASGPAWNGFLAAQVVLGSRVLFNTSTVAQLLLPASSGTKKAYDKHHIFPANFLKGWPYDYAKDRRANFVCVDYQKNIYISDDDPKIYVTKFRTALGDDAYRTPSTETHPTSRCPRSVARTATGSASTNRDATRSTAPSWSRTGCGLGATRRSTSSTEEP